MLTEVSSLSDCCFLLMYIQHTGALTAKPPHYSSMSLHDKNTTIYRTNIPETHYFSLYTPVSLKYQKDKP